MSEDAYPAFGGGEQAAATGIVLIADSGATMSLIAAAGWPVARMSVADERGVTTAGIFALDWRDNVSPVAALADAPSDCAILCLVSLETIDHADALLDGFNARFVFGDSPALIATELAELKSMFLSGKAKDSTTEARLRLQALAMELAQLAERLAGMSSDDPAQDSDAALADRSLGYQAEAASDRRDVALPDAHHIRSLIQMRRLRDRFFTTGLFADPAWDILLDLAASRLEGRSVSVSSLRIAAAVPPTTALRWIRMMTDQQLLVRRADSTDARRMFVDLADSAFDQLCGWFALVNGRGGPGI